MYASIRRYRIEDGPAHPDSIAELRRLTREGFLPKLQTVPGFHAYYMLHVGGSELVTISLFDSREGTAESTRRAAEFVRTTPLPVRLGRPEVTEGELVTAREAAVAAR